MARTLTTTEKTASSSAMKQSVVKKSAATKATAKKSSANKTQKTDVAVADFLATISDEVLRSDCETLITMMKKATGAEPIMWGTTMIGFGDYTYTYTSGREGTWFEIGFAPRKSNLTVYVMPGLEAVAEDLSKIGPYKGGNSCLYLKKLKDSNLDALQTLFNNAVQRLRVKNG